MFILFLARRTGKKNPNGNLKLRVNIEPIIASQVLKT